MQIQVVLVTVSGYPDFPDFRNIDSDFSRNFPDFIIFGLLHVGYDNF